MTKKTYTGPECAALIKNALNESVANGTSPEIKLLKLVAELEGKAEELVGDEGADTIASPVAGAGGNDTIEPDSGNPVAHLVESGHVDPVPMTEQDAHGKTPTKDAAEKAGEKAPSEKADDKAKKK